MTILPKTPANIIHKNALNCKCEFHIIAHFGYKIKTTNKISKKFAIFQTVVEINENSVLR
ncbi:TPA: hypothetical protein DCZ31_02345 [Patescibacteria group bacterium]|nr:hypothetical protein [Candidatus Gracilibacteria bacterium]